MGVLSVLLVTRELTAVNVHLATLEPMMEGVMVSTYWYNMVVTPMISLCNFSTANFCCFLHTQHYARDFTQEQIGRLTSAVKLQLTVEPMNSAVAVD